MRRWPPPKDAQRPRVAVMISSVALGGGERNVIAVLPRLVAAGVDPVLVTLNHRRDSSLVADVEAGDVRRIDLGARRLADPGAARRLVRILRDEGIDLLHTHDQDTHIIGAITRGCTGVPVVMTRHVLTENYRNRRQRVRVGLVLVAFRHGAHRVVAVSEATRSRVLELTRMDPSRVALVYNGIDDRRFSTALTPQAGRRALGLDPHRPLVTMVAVLRPGKGHDVLFQAVPLLAAAVPEVQVLVVGGGPIEEDLRAQGAHLAGTLAFTGERADIPDLLAASDVVILPSWSEALPTVLLEAGAVGRPVVATSVGGAPEIVEEGVTGNLIARGDAPALAERVTGLLADPVLSARLGENARARVHVRFSLDAQAAGLVALYREVLAGR